MKKNFFYAVAILVGMTIGAGIFSLPYAASKAGFFPVVFYLLFLSGVLFAVYLFYAKIISATGKKKRLVGYSQKYLGKTGKSVAAFSAFFGFYGALLVYLILAGRFLNLVLSPLLGGSELLWMIVFFALHLLAILAGLRAVASIEFFMSVFLLLVVFVFLIFGWAKINWSNFINFSFSCSNIFFPYGVVLFSLLGMAAIPEMSQILHNDKSLVKKAIFLGTLIPVLVYLLFVLVVFGVTGADTSKEAILGLAVYFGQPIIALAAIFGIFAVSTSFLVLATNLRKVFQYDYKLPRLTSCFLACFVPLVLYLLGLKNFISIIAFAGGVMGGIDGILILLIYKKVKKIERSRAPSFVLGLLGLVFVLGIFYQIFQLIV